MSSQAHKQADSQPRIHVKNKNVTSKKPLPVPAVAVSKPTAMSSHAHIQAN
jgi:hypothetical protein